jgi:uncharacterized protein
MAEAPRDDTPLSAGPFGAWLDDMRAAIAGARDADVPCGGCTACCRSSQFVHIGPDETDALAHIPRQLLFPAPRMPKGHVLMGYDERGRCPMLTDDGCSIYEHRPRTCRTYDCRVFAAAGIAADADKPAIAQRAARWVFDHPSDADRSRHEAVRTAAVELRSGTRGSTGPVTQTQLAVMAVETAED